MTSIIADHLAITPTVLIGMEQTTDPRPHEIMVGLVTHPHSAVRDVRLTKEESRADIGTLSKLGWPTLDTHNEFVPMAGSLGAKFAATEALFGTLVRHAGPHPEDRDFGEWYTLDHPPTPEPGESRLPIHPDQVRDAC